MARGNDGVDHLYCSWGVKKGLERWNRILIPALAIMIIILAGFSLTLEGAAKGVAFLFTPDWKKLADPNVYLTALGHIIQAARNHNRSLGRLVGSPKEGLADLKQGFDFCCYATDTALYQGALIAGISELRSAINDG